jgi:hypothetical protein
MFFLSESCGTGESRLLQAPVEFVECWKVPASTMISASCGSAVVLTNGFTFHSSLSIQEGINPPLPTELR